MHIHLHLGVHYTSQERLLQALLRCEPTLRAIGIRCGDPGIWQPALRDALSARGRKRLAADWVEATLATSRLRWLVILDEDLLGQPLHLMRDGTFYDRAGAVLRHVAAVFEGHSLSLSLSLIDPAAFVGRLVRRYDPDGVRGYADMMDPAALSWTPMIRDIRDTWPEVPLLVWRQEDLPLVWPTLLRELAGIPAGTPLEADLDLMADLLPPDGFARMQRYLASHPPVSEAQYRQVLRSFLTLYAVEGFADGPGGRLRDRAASRGSGATDYAADVAEIARLPGVRFLRP